MTTPQSPSTLALLGGAPVRSRRWPSWPVATERTLQLLKEAAESGRWAVSGAYTGKPGFERQFAEQFAQFQGTQHSVPTTNGSAALTIAMEELGVGPGTEVIVPGLTWVACASAAAALGAVPILVDVEPDTLSISAAAAATAINKRTAAIVLVHAYCSAADLDAFVDLSRRTGVPIIEDCSQAHGAEWRGVKVGNFGELGVFSFQQTKVLTSGEGGAVTTASSKRYDRLQQYRANGRRYTASPVTGQLELEEVGAVEGHNHSMSEIHAAIALAQLDSLEEQNSHREHNADILSEMLSRIPGVSTLPAPEGLTRRTYYDYVIRLDPDAVGPFAINRVVNALSFELDAFVETLDAPLNANSLYVPLRSPRLARLFNHDEFDPRRFNLPAATEGYRTCFAFLHHLLLGNEEDMADIATAVEKVVTAIPALGERT